MNDINIFFSLPSKEFETYDHNLRLKHEDDCFAEQKRPITTCGRVRAQQVETGLARKSCRSFLLGSYNDL